MQRILLTGGGTGGHIYPLLAITKKIYDLACLPVGMGFKNYELRYYGPQSPYNDLLRQEGIEVYWVMGAKLRRYFSWLNLVDIFKLGLAVLQSLWYLTGWRPDAAFSKGGPGALPVLLACRLYGVPIIIHESDAVMGLTNKISSRWAAKVFQAWGPEGVGIPLREELLELAKKNAAERQIRFFARSEFGFDSAKPLILVLGGSQGSQRINDFIFQNLPGLLEKCHVLHQVGKTNFTEYKNKIALYNLPPTTYHLVSSFNVKEMAAAYAAADLIISRAGSVIFEIAAFGKPSILIPLPEAANNHQLINAQTYAATGAAIIIEEPNLLKVTFNRLIEGVLDDRERYQKMASAARTFAKLTTAETIANSLLTLARGKC